MNTFSDKIIGFHKLDDSSAESRTCSVCFSPISASGVCRNCALHLVDLALSSVTDEFPRLVHETSPDTVSLVYDHFEICRLPTGDPWELGRGSMGITYKAMDTRLGRPVALKIINRLRLAGVSARDRFLREARTAAGLRHPNIASIFHLGLGDEDCFYAMEYVEGETLEFRVRHDGPLPCATALNIVTQVARALRTAHENRFIHRDIKPTNIMLVGDEERADEDKTVKIIDFGLVKALAEGGTDNDSICEGYFAGTPYYASPEQLTFKPVDARSDIFSLGMCLSYMLLGSTPTLASALTTEYPSVAQFAEANKLDGFPSGVLSLLQSMVSVNPSLRPQTARELLQRIQECTSPPHVQSKPTVPSHTWLRRSARDYRWWTAIFGVTILAIATLKLVPTQRMEVSPGSSPRSALLEASLLCAQGDEHYSKLKKAENERAIVLYTKAIRCAPDYALAHAQLARARYQDVALYGSSVSELDAALASAQRATALNPNLSESFTVMGAIRSLQGNHWEALAQIHRALELNPRSAQAMRYFCHFWCTVGEPQLGLPWAIAATQIDPANAGGWGAAADACIDLCADAQAEEYYRRCLAINPGWMSARCGLLHLHLLQGKYATARKECETADSIDPSSILTLTLRAQIALFGGEYSEAEPIYRRLVSINRSGQINYYSSISYLSALGFLRQRNGDFVEAKLLLDEAATLHLDGSQGPQAIYDLAGIRAIQNHSEEALSLLNQAIASGWTDYRATRLDPRFESLHSDPRWEEIVKNLNSRVERMRHESENLCSKPVLAVDYPVVPPSNR